MYIKDDSREQHDECADAMVNDIYAHSGTFLKVCYVIHALIQATMHLN